MKTNPFRLVFMICMFMQQETCTQIICELTNRALWEVQNVIACLPDALWDRPYCEAPLWKHIYHMLHSLDLWYINPRDSNYREPAFHVKDLNDLDTASDCRLTRAQLNAYAREVCRKIEAYAATLTSDTLLEKPEGCEYARFTLILSQFRHLHTHMGMLMGFLIAETGEWPFILGLERAAPESGFGTFC